MSTSHTPYSIILNEFWEDDGEIRMEDERAWFISFTGGDESEDGIERVFSRSRKAENEA